MNLIFSTIVLSFVSSTLTSPAVVDPEVMKSLEKSVTTNVLITFKNSNVESILAKFDSLKIEGRDGKLNTLHKLLKADAENVQSNVVAEIQKSFNKTDLRQLWITNELIARNVNSELVRRLQGHEDVESIQADIFFPLETVESSQVKAGTKVVNWGLNALGIEDVWQTGVKGKNVVVGVIDTGVRYKHEALLHNYRGSVSDNHDYSWFDPRGLSSVPFDDDGHGTHVTGTIVGRTNKIGVAPESHWIACKGCGVSGCSRFDLLECGNWICCPTTTSNKDPDCARAPHIINNSWGSSSSSDTGFVGILRYWQRNGIVPIFSAGDNGKWSCGNIASPADRSVVIAVGSTDESNELSSFSSTGFAVSISIKPNVVAPGSSIVSASNKGDAEYETKSGTSMAAPHVSGVAALIYSVTNNCNMDRMMTILEKWASKIHGTGLTCGGIPDDTYQNYHAGHGLVNASASVQCAKENF